MKAYQYWFYHMPISNKDRWNFIKAFGSVERIYGATEEEMRDCGILKEMQLIKFLEARKKWNLQEEWCRFQEKGIGFVTREMDAFPKILEYYANCPYGLYYLGTLPQQPLMAMVGARNCSQYGRYMAEEISSGLVAHGFGIVSGMARGIDGVSQQKALEQQGYTLAVLGCGVDLCYPRQHRGLYKEIQDRGCILSEFHPGEEPLKQHFPARNRLISGLSQGVIVVEARERSGSLITADFALEQGKEIYAVPGRVTDPMSQGCNRLLKQGAVPILSVESLLQDLMEFSFCMNTNLQHSQEMTLEKENMLVYSCLDFYAMGIEEIMSRTNLDLMHTLQCLAELTEMGVIKEVFKNQYIRLT